MLGEHRYRPSSQTLQYPLSIYSACELTHFSKETPLRPQTSSKQADTQSSLQVSREMLPAIVKLGHVYPLSRLNVNYLLRDSSRVLSMEKVPFYRITDFCFNQQTIKLQHSPVKILNLFLLILFQYCV